MRKFFLLLWKAESRKSEKKWCCSWWLLGWFFFAVIRLCPHSQFYLSFQFYVDTESVLFFLFVWVLFLFSVHKCVLYRDLVFFSSALYSKYTLNVIWVGWKRIKEERREKNERICFGNFNVIRFVVDTLYHCQRLHSIENKRNIYNETVTHLHATKKKLLMYKMKAQKMEKRWKRLNERCTICKLYWRSSLLVTFSCWHCIIFFSSVFFVLDFFGFCSTKKTINYGKKCHKKRTQHKSVLMYVRALENDKKNVV